MLKTIKEEDELKMCTFQPNKEKSFKSNFQEISNKLYKDAKERIINKNKPKEEILTKEHTFKPNLGQ